MRARSRIVVRLAQKERQGQTYWLLRWSGPGLEPDETESRERALAVGFVTKREAETRRRAVEAEVNAAFRGLLVSSSSSRAAPSVSRALDDYIVHIATQRGESDYTRAEARVAGHLTRLIGHVRADLVTTDTLKDYALARMREPGKAGKVKRRTAVDELATLRRALKLLYAKGLLRVPVPGAPRAKDLAANDARVRGLVTEAEFRALIASVRRHHRQRRPTDHPTEELVRALEVLYWLPARPSEIVGNGSTDPATGKQRNPGLSVGDCALLVQTPPLPRAAQKVRFGKTKGGEGRGLRPITEPARLALLAQLASRPADPAALVWPGARGDGPMGHSALKRLLTEAIEAHNGTQGATPIEPIQLYDLRRHAITEVLREVSWNLKAACRYTGHQNPLTLVRYARLDDEEVDELAGQIGWRSPHLQVVKGG